MAEDREREAWLVGDARDLPEIGTGPLRMQQRIGGALCLDFTNTVDDRLLARPRDRLASYDDLLTWAAYAEALTPEQVEQLRRVAASRPDAAESAFRDARLLREALYRVMAEVARGAAPPDADRVALERAYRDALAYADLRPESGRFGWAWPEVSDDLERPLWPILASAIDLLTTADLARLKRCASEIGCSWLFLDTSKSSTRRWCTMELCGSRAKMRRLYARQRATER